MTAARVMRDTTSSMPARSVPPDVAADAVKAVFGVLADATGVAA